MLNTKRKITNPMTVIAMFSLISETSAAISLPFLDNDEREIYIWFLISFPFYLLFLFFLTLNFNYRSLYAPSDFDKDDHFLKAFEEAEGENSGTRSAGRTDNSPDPPQMYDFATPPWIEYHVQLPKPLHMMQVMDVRQMNSNVQFDELWEALRKPGKHPARYVVFLTDPASDCLLGQVTFNTVKSGKKGTATRLYIAYNVSRQVTTVLGGG